MADKNYCTIYIIRHGETDWNRSGRVQSNLPISLNETGREQAKDMTRLLKGVNFSAIYSSDAKRAAETAEIIAADHKLAVNLSQYIKVRACGELVGKTKNEYSARVRELLKKYYAITDIDEYWRHRPMPGHESVLDVEMRILRFLREVAAANIGKKVVVVTHGASIRILLASLGWVSKGKFYKVKVSNAGYIILKSDGTDFRIDRIGGVNTSKTR